MTKEWLGIGCLVLLACSVALGIWVGKSYFEAHTYNRLVGAQTTTWDAMWVQLRVMDSPMQGEDDG